MSNPETESDAHSGHGLRERFERWARDIGYWGELTTPIVGESVATDYFPPLRTATFRIGALSFHCLQDDETGEFQVRLKGSKIPHIADLATLHRAIQESGTDPQSK